MLEQPGNIPDVGYNANGIKPACNGAPNPANKAAVPGKIADDDAAEAIIKNPLLAGTAGANNGIAGATSLKENLVELKELAKKLQVTLGQTKTSIVDIEFSGVLDSLVGEMNAIRAFEGFLLGVHSKIDEFTQFVQFGMSQIMEVEQNMAEFNQEKAMELGRFVLARTMQDTLKALRSQQELDRERALVLLKDEEAKATKLKDEEARVAKQAVSEDEEAKAAKLKDEKARVAKQATPGDDEETKATKFKDEEARAIAKATKLKDEEAKATAKATKLKDEEAKAAEKAARFKGPT